MVKTSFGTRLMKARFAAGFETARAFSMAVGLNENRYARYERGTSEPDYALLSKICDTLGVTPNDLLGYGEIKPRHARSERATLGFGDEGVAFQPASVRVKPGRVQGGSPAVGGQVGGEAKAVDELLWKLASDLVTGRVGRGARGRTARGGTPITDVARLFVSLRADTVPQIARLLVSEDVERLPAAARQRVHATADAIIRRLVA